MRPTEALGNEDFDRLAEQFMASVAKEFLGLGIDEDDPAIFIDDHDRVGGGFEQSAELFLRLFSAGDIPGGGEHPQDVAAGVFI